MRDLSLVRHSPPLMASALVERLPDCARFILRGRAEALAAAGAAFDVPLTDRACRSAVRGARAGLWMSPDEQLLLAPAAEALPIERSVQAALAHLPHSLVDVSHRQLALSVRGPHARSALSIGCPLDLHPAHFPVGMCTRTLMGKADIVLWRTAPDAFHLEVWRSFADYVTRIFSEAARELAC